MNSNHGVAVCSDYLWRSYVCDLAATYIHKSSPSSSLVASIAIVLLLLQGNHTNALIFHIDTSLQEQKCRKHHSLEPEKAHATFFIVA